ncbi:hypothetical protein E4U55_003368 [Claviceps digitariae]|nr:hypothetical protein E4U55_003368 [Claviceps digitariae]
MTRVKPGQRKRAKAPKVRTGASTGRRCVYDRPQTNPERPLLPVMPRVALSSLRHARELFRARASLRLSRFFREELWMSEIAQIAEEVPAIRHAMTSLSSYHELYVMDGSDALARNRLGIRALGEYNLAINGILDQTTPGEHLSSLTSSILFVMIEILRGEVPNALDVLRHGSTVVRQLELGLANYSIYPSEMTIAILKLAKRIFAWLRAEAMYAGRLNGAFLYQ